MRSGPKEYLNDRDWEAFRYLSGEMSAADADSFEQRLTDDVSLGEAVARMVELRQAVQLVASEPARVRSKPSISLWSASSVAAAMAACVIVALALQFGLDNEQPSEETGMSLAGVAASWSLVREAGEHDETEQIADADWERWEPSSLNGDELVLDEADSVVPDWLLTGASLLTENKPEVTN